MYQIIAPTLFQNKVCRLPGIGTLLMVPNSAEADFVNGLINAPFESIEFRKEDPNENLFNEFSAISELLINELNLNGSAALPGIGTFTKANNGSLQFTPMSIDTVFNQPVKVERVIRQDASHAMLVGDQERTNVEMVDFYNESPLVVDRWWIWAIVLAVVGIGALLLYFFQDGTMSLGNSTYY